MDIRQLRHFVTVAEELHFGRAADQLGMTQPPLSQSIQRLEAELGVRLFMRTHRHVEMTPVGRDLLPYAQQILGDAAALPAIARQLILGDIGSLKLSFVSTADYGILPDLLRRYRDQHPKVKVQLSEATSDLQIEALLKDEIDAGIVIAAPGTPVHASLDYLPLRREHLIVALPEHWITSGSVRLTEHGVDLADVDDAPLVIFPRHVAPTLHDAITGCYAARGLTPQVEQEAIQMQTIVSLVSAGLGVALVPESLRNLQRTGVIYVELTGDSPEIETGLIWRRTNAMPTLRGLVRIASSDSLTHATA